MASGLVKPPDLDNNLQPINIDPNSKPPDLDTFGNPVIPEQSFAQSVWQAVNEPLTTIPSTIGKAVSGAIDRIPIMQETGQGGPHDFLARTMAQWRGFASGATEAAGDVASSFTSPLNLGVTAATGGSNLALRAGLPQVARGLQLGARVASIPGAIHGAQEMVEPILDNEADFTTAEPWKQMGGGLVELAGNVGGMTHTPRTNGPILSRLWPEKGGTPTPTPVPPVTPPSSAIPEVIPPPSSSGVGANVNTVKLKPGPNVMDRIVKLTDDGFIASGTDEQGRIIMTRQQQPTTQPSPELTPPPPPTEPQLPQAPPEFAESFGIRPFEPSFFDRMRPETPPMQAPEPINMGPEFSQDMMMTPDELVPTGQGIPPIRGPVMPHEFAGMAQPDLQPIGGGELPPAAPEFMDSMQHFGGNEFSPDMAMMPDELVPTGAGIPDQLGPRMPHEFTPDITTSSGMELVPRPRSQAIEGELLPPEATIPDNAALVVPREQIDLQRFSDEILGPNEEMDLVPHDFEGPQFARTQEGKAKIGVDVKHAAGELTTGYSQPLPAVMVREGLQNALDAVNKQGELGNVTVRLNDAYDQPKSIEITDNGKGMTPDELYTVYTDLHSSGKTNDPNATGGKGVGKAVYMLGGDHFEVETVTNVNGRKIKSSFSGTPDELMAGFDIHTEEVPPETPTGTKFKTTLKKDQDMWTAKHAIDNITQLSRGKRSKITIKRSSWDAETPIDWKDIKNDKKSLSNVPISNNSTKMDVYLPHDVEMGNRSYITAHYLNNGMWQFSDTIYLNEATNGVPDKILIDLKPKVEEGTPDYPFPVQRESVKENTKNEITKIIQDRLVNPLASQKVKDLATMWKQMITIPKDKGKTYRDTVFFDPGDRLTPEEVKIMKGNTTIRNAQKIIDAMIDDILKASGKEEAQKRVVRTGITMDPNMYGVHIPNPSAKEAESAIFINLFALMKGKNPRDAAIDTVVTSLHEAAHAVTGDPPKDLTPMDVGDLEDPRVGRYLQTYIKETMQQGGLDMGHGMPFIKRLGDLYARTGTRTALYYADELERLFQGFDQPGGVSGQYSSEVQRLLHIYDESRGRPATTEDILSGTGIKSSTSGPGEGGVSGTNPTNGNGTTVWVRAPSIENVKKMRDNGFEFANEIRDDGAWKFVPSTGKRPVLESEVGSQRARSSEARAQLGPKADTRQSKFLEAYNFGRTVMASGDLSAPFRQGLGLMHKKEFWTKAFPEMVKAWSTEEGFQASQKAISERPLFKKRYTATGKEVPSFAEDAGLKLTDLESMNSREENMQSAWAEKVPLVRRSNRAYVAFLNNLRASVFESLMVDSKVFGVDAKANVPLARDLAEFVNTATGRGSLGKLESSAKTLNQFLFSPRLIASRVQMLNPHNYIFARPEVRKEYLKSLLMIAAVGNTLTQLGKLAGGDVSSDPNSADYGKLRIGNTRLDPYGGHQQYIVAANRLLRPSQAAIGEPTETGIVPLDMATGTAATGGQSLRSTNTGQSYDLWEQHRPFDPSHIDVASRFLRGKVHPVIGFAWSLLGGRKEISGEKMNFSTLNPFENSIAQRFIPLILQDVYELSQHDPQLIPILAPLAGLGMSVQSYAPEQ